MRSGLTRLSALALTQAQRGRVAVLNARLDIETQRDALRPAEVRRWRGSDLLLAWISAATLAFASIVLGDFVGFEGEAATARQGLTRSIQTSLTQKEQGQAASAFAELLIKDPVGLQQRL